MFPLQVAQLPGKLDSLPLSNIRLRRGALKRRLRGRARIMPPIDLLLRTLLAFNKNLVALFKRRQFGIQEAALIGQPASALLSDCQPPAARLTLAVKLRDFL